MDTISIIGLGKLGSPMMAVFASKGFKVIGLDINEDYVNKINAGIAPVNEPMLQEHIDVSKNNIRATTSYDDAILNSNITFIIVPTPSKENGFFTNKYVLSAIENIGRILKTKQERHIVVITSTTMPGSTNGEIKELLEKTSGKEVGVDVGLCYNPEFIALGTVVRDMLHPDFILLGESDKVSGDIVSQVYEKLHKESPVPIKRMDITSAEVTKIAVNTFVTTKISYANMISEICEKISANAEVVCDALGTDERIGNKYLKPGLGYGGPCFPRDNVAFAALADSVNANSDIAKATDQINKLQPSRVVKKVTSLKGIKKIGIFGLSYKPGTEVCEESQGIMIANELARLGYDVCAFDLLANESARPGLDSNVELAPSLENLFKSSDIIVFCTYYKSFKPTDIIDAKDVLVYA